MAVTANQLIQRADAMMVGIPVAASTRLYQGTLCFTTPAAGYADDDTGSGANAFAGVVRSEVDNSSGSAGDKNVEVETDGVYELVGSSFAQADVGAPVYANDNYAITKTRGSSSVHIGEIVEFVSSTNVKVRLKVKQDPTGAIADPSGGATTDAEARTAINSIIDALEVAGVVVPT